MNDLRFKDDMLEFKKKFVFIFVLIPVFIASAIMVFLKNNDNSDITPQVIALLVVIALAILYVLFSFIYVCVYSVKVVDDNLIVKSIIGKKHFDLKTGLTYTYKQIASTNYYLIVIKSDETKIRVRTKHPKELVDLLLTYNIQLNQYDKHDI